MSIGYQEIGLAGIKANPLNPRKCFDGPKFDELVESIKQKGVIEPIIVREIPSQKGIPGHFEIVAGERRFKAAAKCGLATIPAIVRELTDDEAYDFMLIENLQRTDLTELEEAESFKAYAKLHGEGAAKSLAEKTGIRPAYIRARIAALALPATILEAWRKGDLCYAHLSQLLRLTGKEMIQQVFKLIKRDDMTALELKEWINKQRVLLTAARFDVKGCAGCRNNSQIQADLFDVGDGKAACQQPECFKAKQAEWFKAHWSETEAGKKYKTRGARYDDCMKAQVGPGKGHGRRSSYLAPRVRRLHKRKTSRAQKLDENRDDLPDNSAEKALRDKDWLKSQITTIARERNFTRLELPATGSHVGFMISNGELYDLGRMLLLAVGVNVE